LVIQFESTLGICLSIYYSLTLKLSDSESIPYGSTKDLVKHFWDLSQSKVWNCGSNQIRSLAHHSSPDLKLATKQAVQFQLL